ncbi:MarR family winged helix-turn-helix transcriptional regulator [Rhizobium leguminosarum]|uniref:MarR family winged helix-turn-helix transcriptional regulator n=2 Tax=Rhizobium leguminosarum TaxID=384 RepID=UPI003F9C49C3
MVVREEHEAPAELEEGIYEGLAGVRLAMRRFLAFSEATLADAKVTSQQYQAMLVIKTSVARQIAVRDLAEQMLIQHHGAVQLVDRLSAAGLVERIPSAEDKRSVLVALTSAGDHVLEMLATIHLQGMLTHEPLLAESLSQLRRLASLDK